MSAVSDTLEPSLRKMRRIATGLLILMVFLYVLARSFEESGTGWPWLRAFAEAAMVGALADWFAVTALFRHPLGLPIPHTAIVRKEKERIGAAVASFVRKSFLTPDEVQRQWHDWRPVKRAVRYLAQPAQAEQVLRWAMARLPKLLQSSDRKTLSHLGASGILHGAGTVPMSRMVTILLQGFLKSPGRRSLIAPILKRLGESAFKNREWVMDEASKATKPKKFKVVDFLSKAAASAVSGKAVEKFSTELEAASRDESHPLYEKIEDALGETARELEAGGVDQWEVLKARVIEDPEMAETLEEVVEQAIRLVVESAETLEASGKLTEWSQVLADASARLNQDETRLIRMESRAGELMAHFMGRYGGNVEKLIHRTVESWEANELIERIENQVGADLQFIRVNGTLIGGLVGLILHGLGLVIWG